MIQSLHGMKYGPNSQEKKKIQSLTGISQNNERRFNEHLPVTLLQSLFASFLILLYPDCPKDLHPQSCHKKHAFQFHSYSISPLLFPNIFFSNLQLFDYVAQFSHPSPATSAALLSAHSWNLHRRLFVIR